MMGTYFSPMTTPSIATTFVNLDPLPTIHPFPMMHHLIPTFSPRLGYTEGWRKESGEMKTPAGVLVGVACVGSNFNAYPHSSVPRSGEGGQEDVQHGSSLPIQQRCYLAHTIHLQPSTRALYTLHSPPSSSYPPPNPSVYPTR
jgi:hypothetical protein